MGWLTKLFGSKRSGAQHDPQIDIEVRVSASVPLRPARYRNPESHKEFPAIGEVDPICASCKGQLPKMPGAKAKCPLCGEFNFVRTRPCDRRKVLVNAAQVLLIEEQWATINGTLDQLLAARRREQTTRKQLSITLGYPPSDAEVKLALLLEDRSLHTSDRQWGFVRNTHLQAAQIFEREKMHQEAALEYLVVCFYDLNGANNSRTDPDRDPYLAKQYPQFSPKYAELLPGILARLALCLKRAELNDEAHLKALFEQEAIAATQRGMFLDPTRAWAKVWRALSEQPKN